MVKHVRGRASVFSTCSFGLTIPDKVEFAKKLYETGINAVVLNRSHYANADEQDEVVLKTMDIMFHLTGNIPFGIYECPVPYKRTLSGDTMQN